MSNAKYKIAFIDDSEKTIHIDVVAQENENNPLYRNQNFVCPNCKDRLIPVLAEKRTRHFRHASDDECDPDNYLHAAAENTFYDEYKKCLDENRKFVIETYNADNQREERILTDIYKIITPEKCVPTKTETGYRSYRRPDLLLQSKDGKQLWIEIWVHHRTEESKKRDGDILEIKITSEEDIDKIRTHTLTQQSHDDDSVKLYLKSNNEQRAKNHKKLYDTCRIGIAAICSVCHAKETKNANPVRFDGDWYRKSLCDNWKYIFRLLKETNLEPSLNLYHSCPPNCNFAESSLAKFHAKISPDEKDIEKIKTTARKIVEELIPYINYLYSKI